jgi:hypothetical protein
MGHTIMRNIRFFYLLVAAATVSFSVHAQEIYKSVDENGTVVFSDTPTVDAEEIQVDPNVVEVTQVEPRTAAADSAQETVEAASKSEPASEQEELYVESNRGRDDVVKRARRPVSDTRN